MLYRNEIVKNIVFLSMSCVLAVMSDADAAKLQVKKDLRDAWNAPATLTTGFSHNLNAEACVGDKPNCAPWMGGTVGSSSGKAGTETDEGAVLMLVARQMNANGAKFCVTQVQAANQDRRQYSAGLWCGFKQKASAWTEYYSPTGADAGCFWLCKNGYYGAECKSTTPPELYDTALLKQDNFKDFKRLTTTAPANIEDKIEMFHINKWASASSKAHNGYEYDMFLGITRWTSGGHGAFAAPIAMRSATDEKTGAKAKAIGNCTDITVVSTPVLQVVGKETLLCKDGYRHNTAGTDCIATDEKVVELSKVASQNKFCSGFESGFDVKNHVLRKQGNCYTYRCTNGNLGFQSRTDRTCVECKGEIGRFGVAENGVCVSCPIGTNFDPEDTSSEYCPKATAYSSSALIYGIKGSPNDKISDQCWTYTDIDAYKECVKNGAAAANSLLNSRKSE